MLVDGLQTTRALKGLLDLLVLGKRLLVFLLLKLLLGW